MEKADAFDRAGDRLSELGARDQSGDGRSERWAEARIAAAASADAVNLAPEGSPVSFDATISDAPSDDQSLLTSQAFDALLDALLSDDVYPNARSASARHSSGATLGSADLRAPKAARKAGIPVADSILSAAVADGVGAARVVNSVLPEVAHRLGELWERDEVTFADVSIALCRMHALVRDERWRGSFRRPPGPAAPRVLLSTIRGDQHTFGLSVAADAFRRARWLTSFAGGVDADELVALIATESFDVLALSATNSIATRRIASFVADCRRASKRENLIVVAGGQAFAEGAAAASEFGVDLILERAEAAPEAVRSLIAEQEAERV